MKVPVKHEAETKASRRTTIVGALVVAVLVLFGIGYYVQKGIELESLAKATRAAVEERRFDEARPLIARWTALSPRAGEPYYLLAQVELTTDSPQPVADALKEATARNYDQRSLNIIRAIMLSRGGQSDEAEPVLRDAFANGVAPKREIDEGLARISLAKFKMVEAAEVIDRWMKDAPDDPRPYLWRNQIDERNDSHPSFLIRNYRQALKLDPNNEAARLGLANKLREVRETTEAEAEYGLLISQNPKKVEAHIGAGQNSIQKGDIQGATRHFEDALKIDPSEPVALRELALLDLRSGRFEQARDRLKIVVEKDEFDPESRFNYARALKMSGDAAKAEEQTLITTRLRKEHHDMSSIRLDLMRNPNDVSLRSKAAEWLLAHGHDKEGLDWTQLILREHPNHPPTCKVLVDYYTRKGNVGLANFYRLAASKQP